MARELDGAPTTAFVTEGAHADPARGWPHALAAGPAIATAGETLLLTGPDQLSPEPADVVGPGAAPSLSRPGCSGCVLSRPPR